MSALVGSLLRISFANHGDLHEPLHCADRNGDKGGNGRLVFFPGRKKAVSLHMVWDTLILPRSKGKQSVAEYGHALNAKINEKQAKAWAKGGTAGVGRRVLGGRAERRLPRHPPCRRPTRHN